MRGAPVGLGGLASGTGLWLLADELVVPLLSLAKGPTATPLPEHTHSLGAHLAYGVATSGTTQLLRRLI